MAELSNPAGHDYSREPWGQDLDNLLTAVGRSLPSAKYRLVSDGSTVTAYDTSGAAVASGTDGGAVLAAVFPAAGSLGSTIEFRNDGNVFPWSTVPALPKGITNRLLIRGNGATIRLSAAAPRFLDFNKTADHDVFQHIEVTDFVVDCNSQVTSGSQHVILGNYVAAGYQTRLNFDRITVRRVRAINVPVATSGGYRLGIALTPVQISQNEATQNYATNILIEDVRVEGGNYGVAVFGSPVSLAGQSNMLVDNILIQRCWHSALSAPSGSFVCANFQIGGQASGGRVTIRDCEGYFSSDVGIEIDSTTDALVENCKIEDAFNYNYYFTNQATPKVTAEARITFRHCQSRHTNVDGTAGYLANNSNSIALGSIRIEDCSHYTSRAANVPAISAQTVQLASITIAGFRGVQEGISYTGGSATFPRMIKVKPATTTAYVRMERVFTRITGSRGGAGAFNYVAVNIDGLAVIDLNDIEVEDAMTGLSATSTNAVAIGAASGSNIRGTVRGVIVGALGDDATPRPISIGGSASLATAGITVERCDFSGLTNNGGEFVIGDATNKAIVRARSNIWKTKPAPSGLLSITSAVGAPLATIWDAVVVFVQGSGSGITAIDFSTDGGTSYRNFLTQAAAALPGGFDQSLGPLPSDTLIKVTFTTTQPTINLIPVNP